LKNGNKMKINILLPVYNDWDSLNFLLKDIKKIRNNTKLNSSSIEITIINDCSTLAPVIDKELVELKIRILGLSKNIGSQHAINIGLRYLEKNNADFDYCIIMDSDGEDKAEDLQNLLKVAIENKGKTIFASRGKRQDGLLFQLLYKIYLFFFYIFTGKNINFGNFSCIPNDLLNIITKLNYSKIHHSASILKSNLPIMKIKCNRGKRFMGKSKMSLDNLFFHGLNGMAIFFELIIRRFFIIIGLLIVISVMTIASIFILKIYSFIEVFNWFAQEQIYFTILFVIFLLFGFLSFLKKFNRNINNINKTEINLKDIIVVEEKFNF